MSISEKTQQFLKRNLTLEDVLPTKMPVYVNSVAYLFGAATLAALIMLILTGLVMVAFGPTWYHHSGTGHFFNSLHYWSTEVFFGALVLHILTKFFMAAWRDGRWKAWLVGFIIFAVVVPTALTGFLSQTNWDSQWIAVQAKDALNSLGVGAWLNTMNTGQILALHMTLLPVAAVVLLGLHIYFVRRDGPVKPIESSKKDAKKK
jgi:ubiquinol-cytochrome c reductase cytochrome b subunit